MKERRVRTISERLLWGICAGGLNSDGAEFPENIRCAIDLPCEMMTATAQHMEGADAVVRQNAFDGFGDRFLQLKCSHRIQIRLGHKIKIHIFHIQMGDQRFAIPEGPANIEPIIELRIKCVGKFWPPHGLGGAIRRDVVAGRALRTGAAEEFQDTRSHSGLFVIRPKCLQHVFHGGGGSG